MKNNTYHDAVEHLRFTDDLEERVMLAEKAGKRTLRFSRAVALAAALCLLLVGTAIAASPAFQERTVDVTDLGTDDADLSDAQVMEFGVSEDMQGVSVHYMELEPGVQYTFVHGMLYSAGTGYMRITEDYRLEPLEMENLLCVLNKNDRKYMLNFSYIETDDGIVSIYRDILQKNENGEVFLNPTDGKSNQWPVYLNLETGEVRDALPDWTEDDFEGRVGYAFEMMDGILVMTIVNDGVVENGTSVSYNMLYWIADGATEAKIIELPDEGNNDAWYCENNTLYYKNNQGHLYRMDENFDFQLIAEYETRDDLTNGLITIVYGENQLAILDVYTGNTYVIPGITVTSRDLNETLGYNAIRYSQDGIIALVKTTVKPYEERIALEMLGMLNTQTGELKLLEIENDYDGYQNHWLDNDRYGVIYENDGEQYLCIYEFTV